VPRAELVPVALYGPIVDGAAADIELFCNLSLVEIGLEIEFAGLLLLFLFHDFSFLGQQI